MRELSSNNVTLISAGYSPPENPDTEPFRAGMARIGGYVNYRILQNTGFDITGDTITGNKLLGLLFMLPTAPFVVTGIINQPSESSLF